MLFRKQVVEARQKRLYGEVLIATPIKFWVVTTFLIGVIGVLLVFLATASFARIETVRGVVVPSDGIVQVRASGGGVLTDFNVREGQSVISGEVVGRIAASTAANDAGTRIGAELASIASNIEQLNARIEHSAIVTQLEIAATERERANLAARIQRAEDMRVFEIALLHEAESGAGRISQLSDRNLVNVDAVSQQNVQLNRARQEVQRLRAEIDTLDTERANIVFEQDQARLNELQMEAEWSCRAYVPVSFEQCLL